MAFCASSLNRAHEERSDTLACNATPLVGEGQSKRMPSNRTKPKTLPLRWRYRSKRMRFSAISQFLLLSGQPWVWTTCTAPNGRPHHPFHSVFARRQRRSTPGRASHFSAVREGSNAASLAPFCRTA